jgi:poly(3-hydroxybutyrate) depolymerase
MMRAHAHPPQSGNFTGGSGGAFTDAEFQTYSGNGQTSQYHLYASGRSAAPSTPLGVVLHFHGDGAWSFDNPDGEFALGGSDGVRAVAAEFNMLCVPMRTPNSDLTWWSTGDDNADWIASLVQNLLYDKYDIDLSRIWLSGYSGGANLISRFFVPEYSSMIVDGGAVISGGGGRPWSGSSTINSFDDSFKQSYAMHWFTATGDTGWDDGGYNAYQDAIDGEQWYIDQGFTNTSHLYPPGGGHSTVGYRFGEQLRIKMVEKYGEP